MNEIDKDDEALRALFAAQVEPTDGPAFAAAIGDEVRRRRATTRARVHMLTSALAGLGGVFALANFDALSATLANAAGDAAPMLSMLNAGGGLVLLVAAAGAAYVAAERA
jgi:hypothetical protein